MKASEIIRLLDSIRKQFHYYKHLGDRSIERLSDEELCYQYNAESNSIAIIVKHLWGNMLSRWTEFLTADGEKSWRQREAEFEPDLRNRAALLEKWEAGWQCLFNAIAQINPDNFHQTVYIRNQAHTIPEALLRQLAHYAYHVGQMVYLARMVRGEEWESLSIPRGGSAAYNRSKFEQPERGGHYTDEFTNPTEPPQT